MEENNNYWDYISTLDNKEIEEPLKELIKDAFKFFNPYLNELFYIEANYIYLNYVWDLPQALIGDLFGVSQYGVSKRIKSGVSKINTIFKRPENDRNTVRQDFKSLFPDEVVEIIVLYYFMKTFSLVVSLTDISYGNMRNKVNAVIKQLESYTEAKTVQEYIKVYQEVNKGFIDKLYIDTLRANNSFYLNEKVKTKRYFDYLSELVTTHNYGDYLFKRDDDKRLKRFD